MSGILSALGLGVFDVIIAAQIVIAIYYGVRIVVIIKNEKWEKECEHCEVRDESKR